MEHQNTVFCPKCHSDILFVEEGGVYRCSECHTKFYRGALAGTEDLTRDGGVYYPAKDPARPSVHLTSQISRENTQDN